jgi:hypothetical protein
MASRGFTFKRILRWFPRSSASSGGLQEQDEDSSERNGLLRSHQQHQIVPVTDLGGTSKALASLVEPKVTDRWKHY